MSEAAPGDAQHLVRRRRVIAVLAAATVAVLLAGALTLAAGDMTVLSSACGSCHVIAPSVATWHQGAHSQVGCYKCHERKASFAARIEERTLRLRRDVWKTVTGTSEATPTADLSVIDSSCQECHNLKRQPSSGGTVIIKHESHARRNNSCLSCHLDVGHPGPVSEQALDRMQLCFECHSKKAQSTASRQCGTCHPASFELTPASHKSESTWNKQHGKAALIEQAQCEMCHLGKLCEDCHGLIMPHPDGWLSAEDGHPSLNKSEAATCAKCHEAKPQTCSTCHHPKHDPALGPWNRFHFAVVEKDGAARCMRCHDGPYCAKCHATLIR